MDNLRELQLVELNILKELLALFEKNNIRYFALGGTVLGAVRHQGFIPWDDDIDLGVPREDYDRLGEVFSSLPKHLTFCSVETEPEYLYYFAKLEDKRVRIVTKRSACGEEECAWVDLFPLDGMPDRALSRRLHAWKVLACRALFVIARFDEIANLGRDDRPAWERAMIWCAKTFRLQKLFDKKRTYAMLDRTLRKCPYADSGWNINAMGIYKLNEMFDKRVFGDGRMYPFEDIEICGPQDYETYLTQLYGDWRTPADQTHHKVVEITLDSTEVIG